MKRKTMTDRVAALACALSMILSIFVGVPLPTLAQSDTNTTQNETNVSAKDEIKTIYAYGATGGEASWESGDIATVTKKYFAVSFTMNAAEYAGIPTDNGCCGLMFGNTDDTCVFIPYDGDTTDTQRKIGIWGSARVMFGKWWGTSDFGPASNVDISEYVDKDVTILVLGEKNDDGTTTLTAYINGNQVNVWGNQESATATFNGRLQWALRLNDSSAVCKFAESDDILLPTVFDEKCEHTFGRWTANVDGHFRTCTKCGEADSGAHVYDGDLFYNSGTHYYACTVCSMYRLVYEHDLKMRIDQIAHQSYCTECPYVSELTEHTWGDDGCCSICGSKKPANPMGFCGADGSNMTWELDLESGLLTITGKGEMGNTLPWSNYADIIKMVEIGEGVTSIADGAFIGTIGFISLETVILPKSLEKIGDNAFYGCVNLTFAGSVQKTVYSAFSRARVIEPDTNLREIGNSAFCGCVKLKSFDIPTELETLGDKAFKGCESMESVVVPKTTVYGGSGTFSGCTSLKNVEFAEGTGISMNMFSDCTSLETIELPSDIESIPTGAFNGCTSLREIALPDTVERISKDAFNGCTSLESIELPETLKKVEDGAFGECTSLEKIVVNGKDTEFENASATIPENSVIYCAPDAKVLEYTTENVREVVIEEHEHSGGTYEHNSDKHWCTCTDCGNPYDIAVHVYDDACDTTCNICGRVREPLHDWSDAWSSDSDSHWHECTLCGQKKDVAKHDFGDDGECECGQLPFIYGDANGDGRVTSADIIMIKKYIANYDKSTNTSTVNVFVGADANGDGMINSSDVILLKKYIANLDKDGNSSIILGKR